MRSPLLALLLLAGCPAPEAAPPAAPPTTPAAAPAAPTDGALTGTVTETMDAAGYTYLHLQTADGMKWAAVEQSPVQTGQTVRITNFSWMQGFHSKTLDRTFDQIAFGRLAPGGAPAGTANPHAPVVDFREVMKPAAPTGASGHGSPDPATVTAPVAKAQGDNAHTVADVFAGKSALVGKTVAIRGKVVKFTPGVMNTNWLHLQDGSGSAAAKDHDVTVTTDDTATVGDVVVVEGLVVTDKDLGAGYRYDVLIEGATVSR